MQPDPPPSSSYRGEIDIILLSSLEETSQHILHHVQKFARDVCSATLHRISKFSHVEYELQRTIVSGCNCGGGYLLVFVVHKFVEFRMTDLTKHFGIYLSCMAICHVFVVFLCVLFAFCLVIRKVVSGMITSTDNITRCDS